MAKIKKRSNSDSDEMVPLSIAAAVVTTVELARHGDDVGTYIRWRPDWYPRNPHNPDGDTAVIAYVPAPEDAWFAAMAIARENRL